MLSCAEGALRSRSSWSSRQQGRAASAGRLRRFRAVFTWMPEGEAMTKRGALALLPSLLLGACSVVGIRDTPEPASTVIDRIGTVEIIVYGTTEL